MDIRFLTSIYKNMAYCLLNGSRSGSFAVAGFSVIGRLY